jgi:hypothetical protein
MKRVHKPWWILKMDYKRQTAVLSVMFVLLGLMFLVPAITEKAQARVDGRAFLRSAHLSFSDVRGDCGTPPKGFFSSGPRNLGKEIVWTTMGTPIPYGDEKCHVHTMLATLPHPTRATYSFSNPSSGRNTCTTYPPPPKSSCTITQGVNAVARFETNIG